MWPFKNRASRDSIPQPGAKQPEAKPMVHGAPKRVGPQIPIDPDNPKPPVAYRHVRLGPPRRDATSEAPSRPATAPKETLLTADDLLRLYGEGVRGELIRGVLHQTVAAGIEHGQVVMNLGSPLTYFVRSNRLGRVVGSDAGVRLEQDPDTVREPDIAFISADRLPPEVRVRGYAEVVPDLVVEVVSPSDRPAPVHDKALMWLHYGVRLVWVVDPGARTIQVMPTEGQGPAQTLYDGDILDGGDVLPGFTCPVQDVFDP